MIFNWTESSSTSTFPKIFREIKVTYHQNVIENVNTRKASNYLSDINCLLISLHKACSHVSAFSFYLKATTGAVYAAYGEAATSGAET